MADASATSNPRPIIVVGPTAGGKSDLAVALALALRSPRGEAGEIINADSMQVYRHMDAGTAKPPGGLRRQVVHHLIDLVEPTERFTLADWLAQAEALIAGLQQRGVRPVVVGGTNLYLRALLEGIFEAPAIDTAFRAGLAHVHGLDLHRRLAEVDPASAQRIHPNDKKKLIRALEVFHLTGTPISAMQTQWSEWDRGEESGPKGQESGGRSQESERAYRHNPILIGLDWPAEAINRRINARVKAMFVPAEPGVESLVDETRRLETAGLLGAQAREALGYKQVLTHLQGRCTLEEAFEKTKILTRRFAKQQRTWLKRYRGVHWLAAADVPMEELARQALDWVIQEENPPS